MKKSFNSVIILLLGIAAVVFTADTCTTTPIVTSGSCCHNTKVVAIYDGDSIPANIGISTGQYTNVDSFRYVNVFVEFSQETASEEPVSLGVIFALDQSGAKGSRRYFNFEQNFEAPADPQMITLSGKGSWHGAQHKKSSYLARLPIMGPYMQVFPFNHHSEKRLLSVVLYLTD